MKQPKRIRRQIFVLTPEEKKAAGCVLAALLLGLATMHYRATHPTMPRPPTAKEQRIAKITMRSTAGKARVARKTASLSTPALTPEADADEE